MGLFLAFSGVMGASASAVREALEGFAKARSGGFELAKGTTEDPNIGVISRRGANTTVFYPDGFCEWDHASQHISNELRKPVFSLHIHDGDLWMYVLFSNGEQVGQFNPLPQYWGEVSVEEKEKWKGDAELVARVVPRTMASSIARYLVEWDLEKGERVKAYADDEFPMCNCWQMCDFMSKIGLEYPIGNDGVPLGDTFKLWTEKFPPRNLSPKPSSAWNHREKPWWKLW